MKIYTKTGDQGKTSLFSGRRVSKTDIQIEAYGTVDELNTQIGLLKVKCEQSNYDFVSVIQLFGDIQHILFSIGGYLAGAYRDGSDIAGFSEKHIDNLENEMDNYNETLPALTNFVLPGGNELSSIAHVCRTVCRRAERRVVNLADRDEINPMVVKFLNRLSDYFFVLSRKLIYDLKDQEVIWTSPK